MRLVAIALLLALPALAEERFYFSGDGTLRLANAHFAETLDVRYRDADGRYDPEALARITRFFRSRSDGRSGPMALRLIELLDWFEDHYRPRRLVLVSGYRSPELNQSLRAAGRRVAQTSMHTEGLAADVQPVGLDLRRLWNALRRQEIGGVGLYQREGFLHLDTGRARFWEAATSKVDQNLARENARLFARTDFDRYDTLDGAVISLHSVTALPIAIRRQARLGDAVVAVAPRDDTVRADGDCWLFADPAERYELVVRTPLPAPADRRPITLDTCPPRIGATPAQVVTNPLTRLRDAAR
ncbi:YcbK family protein [bacterium]|nr:YcbK family protein [bacterium]